MRPVPFQRQDQADKQLLAHFVEPVVQPSLQLAGNRAGHSLFLNPC